VKYCHGHVSRDIWRGLLVNSRDVVVSIHSVVFITNIPDTYTQSDTEIANKPFDCIALGSKRSRSPRLSTPYSFHKRRRISLASVDLSRKPATETVVNFRQETVVSVGSMRMILILLLMY
jgi:hypothetical protein